mgnify:FL=1
MYVQHAPEPVQTSLVSPAKLASITNQLRIGGRDLIITNIISNDRTALRLLVFMCLFKRSNCFIPLNSILMK